MNEVQHFYDKDTGTLSYITFDPASRDAIVIDPVWNFDPNAGKLSLDSAREIMSFLKKNALELRGILETHVHADHLSSAQFFKSQFPRAILGIGAQIQQVQEIFGPLFGVHPSIKAFDRVFEDEERVQLGTLTFSSHFAPGHTPACALYRFDNLVFTGDVLFMPDAGTGRCDFPGGSATALYHSITKTIYSLPGTTTLFTGHDYQPGGRELRFKSTVAEQKASNIHLNGQTQLDTFVEFREKRDQTLSAPRLLLPSLQVNIFGGRLPEPEANGKCYLKIPLTSDSKI